MRYKSRTEVYDEMLKAFTNLTGNDKLSQEIAFHLTDWEENLEEINRIFNAEERVSEEYICRSMMRFLSHVPNHVAAAKKLIGLGPIEDIFNADVFKED